MDQKLAAYIDHTLLRPNARPEEIVTLCREAMHYGFGGVCIQPWYVGLAAKQLAGSPIHVVSVIGFPHGNHLPEVKRTEAEWAVRQGATELDMVINIAAAKSGDFAVISREIADIVNTGRVPVKVILETCYLTDAEKIQLCQIAREAGAAFVKTSTGFAEGGATIHDVALMRQTVGSALGVKAAGGIRNAETAWAMIQAGATRIGASAGVKMVQEA